MVIALTAAVGRFIWVYAARRDFFDLRIYVSAMRWWADGHPLYEYAQPTGSRVSCASPIPRSPPCCCARSLLCRSAFTIGFFCVFTVAAVAVAAWWLTAPIADRRGPAPLAARRPAVPGGAGARADPRDVLLRPDQHGAGAAGPGRLLPRRARALVLGRRRRRPGHGDQAVPGHLHPVLPGHPPLAGGGRVGRRRGRATLLAAAVRRTTRGSSGPTSLFSTERVGRTDYTGNQSLQGLLARLVAPEEPAKVWWLLLVVAVTACRHVAGGAGPSGPATSSSG